MKKDHSLENLELMLGAAKNIGQYIYGMELDGFLSDSKTQSAVIMQLIVIGELAKRMPEEVTDKVDLPWNKIAGFRNLAVHEYFELDLKQVWETATNYVLDMEEKLKHYSRSSD